MQNNSAKFKTNLFLNKTILIFLLLTVFSLLLAAPVLATEYKLLESIPGGPSKGETPKIFDYLTAIFKFAIAAAAILAVVMIVIGGLQYIGAAGNTSVIEDAKDRIYWAVAGLLLSLGSVLILQTISPDFLKFELGIEQAKEIGSSQCFDNACPSGWEAASTNCSPKCETSKKCCQQQVQKPFACYIQFETGASTNLPYDDANKCQNECIKVKLEKKYVGIQTAYCYGKDLDAATKVTNIDDCELLKTEDLCQKTTICKWYASATYGPGAPPSWCRPDCGKFKDQPNCENDKNKAFCVWKANIDMVGGSTSSCQNK